MIITNLKLISKGPVRKSVMGNSHLFNVEHNKDHINRP